MNEFIKSIFMSDTCGVEKIKIPQNKEYTKINKREDELYEKLKATLSPELFATFDEFINALLDRHAIISEQYYIAGSKIGLRLAAEAFDLSDIFKEELTNPRRLSTSGILLFSVNPVINGYFID